MLIKYYNRELFVWQTCIYRMIVNKIIVDYIYCGKNMYTYK